MADHGRSTLLDFMATMFAIVVMIWCLGNMLLAWSVPAHNAPIFLVNIVAACAVLWIVRTTR